MTRAGIRALVAERKSTRPLRPVEPAAPRAARAASVEWLGRRPLCERAPSGFVDHAELDALILSRGGVVPEERMPAPGTAIEIVPAARTATHPVAWIALLIMLAWGAAALLRTHHESTAPDLSDALSVAADVAGGGR